MADGIPLDLVHSNPEAAGRLSKLGLVTTAQGRLRLTDAGFDVHNQVVLALLTNPRN